MMKKLILTILCGLPLMVHAQDKFEIFGKFANAGSDKLAVLSYKPARVRIRMIP